MIVDIHQTQSSTGPLDEDFAELAQARFDRLIRTFPLLGTYLGVHSEDARLGSGTREAIEGHVADERGFLAAVEALDADGLSDEVRFERDLAIQSTRRGLFDDEVHRVWERRVSALDELGDSIFLLFARDFAPLSERLASITGRIEDAPRLIEEHKTRLGDRPMRLWNELELDVASSMPSLFEQIDAAAAAEWDESGPELRRFRDATARTTAAIEGYAAWIREQLARADDEFALGREHYDELVGLRAFDGLTSDEILAIGEEQLAANHEGRRRAARELDASAEEAAVLDRVKSNHPPDFDAALREYRESIARARKYVVDHGIATMPDGERLDVVPTPEYLRNVIPFAAYFQPAKFDRNSAGIYIVTPSVDGDPRALLEHSYASISNTCIHEAYPGHHQQLSRAVQHPSLTRLLIDAPEFVEGWAMYCEQMMREEGFDDTAEHHVIMYTDAIWRACRIVLDVKLHRGEINVPDAIDFLVQHTGFERPNAAAEVKRYTYTPTYQLSYLLGKVLLLRLREDERRRLGADFSLSGFHDALLGAGSLPISFHRRLLERPTQG